MEKIKDFLSVETGYGDGYGYGYGDGDGDGYGDGYGSGRGSSDNISFFDGLRIYNIDGISTAITHVHRNIAKGYILNDDFTLTPCYVAKGQNRFAHGGTAEVAIRSLEAKIFEDLDVEERISAFLEQFNDLNKKYPARSFYEWHYKLTGSCEMGRQQFARQGGYDLDNDTFTVEEFISITRNAYGGEVIGELESAVKKKMKTEAK